MSTTTRFDEKRNKNIISEVVIVIAISVVIIGIFFHC